MGVLKGGSAYCKAYTVLALRRLKYNIDDIERILLVMDGIIDKYDQSRALSKAQKVMDNYKLK